jgi:hypothetical protein
VYTVYSLLDDRGKYSGIKGQQSAAKGIAFSFSWIINGIYFQFKFKCYLKESNSQNTTLSNLYAQLGWHTLKS